MGYLLAFQVLHRQVVVNLRDRFHQPLARFLSLVRHAVRRRFVRVQQIHDPGERILLSYRQLNRHEMPPEPLLKRLYHRAEVGVLPVHLGYEHDAGQVAVVGELPHLARSDLDARLSRHHYHRAVRHSHARYHFAAVIRVAGRVNHVYLVVFPLRIEHGGVRACLALLLFRLEIRGRSAVFDSPQTGRRAGRVEHSFGQYSLARPTMRQKDYVPDALSGKVGHSNTPDSGL